jgi:hypothetical protein
LGLGVVALTTLLATGFDLTVVVTVVTVFVTVEVDDLLTLTAFFGGIFVDNADRNCYSTTVRS